MTPFSKLRFRAETDAVLSQILDSASRGEASSTLHCTLYRHLVLATPVRQSEAELYRKTLMDAWPHLANRRGIESPFGARGCKRRKLRTEIMHSAAFLCRETVPEDAAQSLLDSLQSNIVTAASGLADEFFYRYLRAFPKRVARLAAARALVAPMLFNARAS